MSVFQQSCPSSPSFPGTRQWSARCPAPPPGRAAILTILPGWLQMSFQDPASSRLDRGSPSFPSMSPHIPGFHCCHWSKFFSSQGGWTGRVMEILQVVELDSPGEWQENDSPVYVCVSDFSGWPLVGKLLKASLSNWIFWGKPNVCYTVRVLTELAPLLNYSSLL